MKRNVHVESLLCTHALVGRKDPLLCFVLFQVFTVGEPGEKREVVKSTVSHRVLDQIVQF